MKINYVLILFLFCTFFVQSQIITTIAGSGSSGFSGDGGLATTARLNLPFNITFDKSDNIYIADTYNNSIRKIDSESGIISTVVGTADKRQVSELKTPTGLTFDNFNNLFIADLANLRIRKVNLDTGSSITLVGEKSETERPNINATLGGPFNVVFDKIGNLYVSINGDSKVSKIEFSTGKISTVAGTDLSGFSGDGDLAKDTQLSNPLGLAVDKSGDLYVVDRGNNRVRKINMTTGIIGTIAGTGEAGFSGDGDLARNALLSNPTGLAFNRDGDLYVVDRGNNRIRRISGLTSNTDELELEASLLVYPNPSTDKITIELKNDLDLKRASLFNIKGKQVRIEMTDRSFNVSKLPRGIYILRIVTSKGISEQKVVLE